MVNERGTPTEQLGLENTLASFLGNLFEELISSSILKGSFQELVVG